ncbi:MAG: hypothetical protein ABI629_21465 [bacterium]
MSCLRRPLHRVLALSILLAVTPLAASAGDIPDTSNVSSANLQAMQDRLQADPQMARAVQSLRDDPQVQSLLADPAIASALAKGDLAALFADPRIQRLAENPTVRTLTDKVGQ